MNWRKWCEFRWYYSWPAIWCHRVWLWCRLVGRMNQGGYRTGPLLGWELACIVWDEGDHFSVTRERKCQSS